MTDAYQEFVTNKLTSAETTGIEVADINPDLFPHAQDLTRWALRRGRAAIFAGTGMGKSSMLAEWSRHVSKFGRVLVAAPLAVAQQLVREFARFGVEATYLREDDGTTPIVITNYDMIHAFDAARFVGVALDESSLLKAHDGATRNALITMFAHTPFRLCASATPAPNDHTELGNHAEFLGIKTRVAMLAEFFCHDGGNTSEWRLKGHAEDAFWIWLSSWGAIVSKPSDLGHDDSAFVLPPLRMHEHVIPVEHSDAWSRGMLFAPQVTSLSDQRTTRRMTMQKRVAKAAELAAGDEQCIIWGELNDECDAVTKLIPDAMQVAGSDDREVKASRMLGFADGLHRVIVSKPGICGHGMNWQNCAKQIFLGASHSFEQTFQAIRRVWRFGQKRPVDIHVIRAETEDAIVENYNRKEQEFERMQEGTRRYVLDAVRQSVNGSRREYTTYRPQRKMTVPQWLKSA